MVSNKGCTIESFFLAISPPLFPLMACRCQHSTPSNTTYAPSFQWSTEYTPCSIDQCEDAQLGEPPHMPPFQFPLAPSHTPLPHRNHSPEYARHDQERAP